MKKSVLFFAVAMASTALLFSSCKKDENEDVNKQQITVSEPIIDPECVDMYLYEDLEPNIISWSEPVVSGDTKVKFEYQFVISEDEGATWKAFERQEYTSVAIKKDYRYSEKLKQYVNFFTHDPLPDSNDIPFNYLDSLNEDTRYLYKIRAYYTNEKSEEVCVESTVGKFLMDINVFWDTYQATISNNQMTISWNFPKSNLKKVVVLYSQRLVVDRYSEDIWNGKTIIDDYYKNNYYKECTPEETSVIFDKPDPKYDFNGVEIVFWGNKDGQVAIGSYHWSNGLNNLKWD